MADAGAAAGYEPDGVRGEVVRGHGGGVYEGLCCSWSRVRAIQAGGGYCCTERDSKLRIDEMR